jgi:hypothetical protein
MDESSQFRLEVYLFTCGSDVVTAHEQMRGERVTKGVDYDALALSSVFPLRPIHCKASAGWTAAARRAGIQLAMNATARSATGVTLSVTKSVGPTA